MVHGISRWMENDDSFHAFVLSVSVAAGMSSVSVFYIPLQQYTALSTILCLSLPSALPASTKVMTQPGGDARRRGRKRVESARRRRLESESALRLKSRSPAPVRARLRVRIRSESACPSPPAQVRVRHETGRTRAGDVLRRVGRGARGRRPAPRAPRPRPKSAPRAPRPRAPRA